MRKVIMIMIDGFGIPPSGWKGSVYDQYGVEGFMELLDNYSLPVDASMGVDGIPQSATGQTALFTGANASEIMGGHLQGFPGPTLRKVIRSGNLFSMLISKNKRVTFANAYIRFSLEQLKKKGFRSVTTIMTESSLGKVRGIEEYLAGEAIYHDLTGATIPVEYDIPPNSPQTAAENLASLAKNYDLTLFEYFLTDRAGHKQNAEMLSQILCEFSNFLLALAEKIDEDTVILLTSDHGNCEDLSVRTHTRNPVPLFVYGGGVQLPDHIFCITEICGFVKDLLLSPEGRQKDHQNSI